MNDLQEKKPIQYRKMIDILMGKQGCADVILEGGFLINVLTREIYQADVAIKNEYILLVGDCKEVKGEKTKVIDVRGKYISPGFIDAHMHFESSMLTCTEFSKLSLLGGTTTLFADPHEIANVSGLEGIEAMLKEATYLPSRILFTVPALVPDVPGLETPGQEIDSRFLKKLLEEDKVAGLGEMQGFSNTRSVYEHAEEVIDDLLVSSAMAQSYHKTIEGNAPGLFGKDLAAHILVCGGETSCHETTTKEECMEKVRNGVTVFMREGSTQKNMAECIRTVKEEGIDSGKLVLATDDMSARDLLESGHMNSVIAKTIAQGIDPVEAIQMATINPARHYGRKDIGVIAPGKAADICVLSDLNRMKVETVLVKGKVVAQGGKLCIDIPHYPYPDSVKHSMKCGKIKKEAFQIHTENHSEMVRGIQVIEDQNLTECIRENVEAKDGILQPDIGKDLLPFIVIERHGKSQRIGKTFVRGFGLKAGAIAQSIGHDTHNLLVVGTNYEDMEMAANRVCAMEGGIALIKEKKIVGDLPLKVAGLMSDEMTAEELAERLDMISTAAEMEMGCKIHDPFMHLSFLTLVTSPTWKLTDYGLIDVEKGTVLETVERSESKWTSEW